jgi:hypothetical protein
MARSSTVSKSKRRKSLRVHGIEPEPLVSEVASVARARRRSTSTSSPSSDQSLSLQPPLLEEGGPSRRLRSRTSLSLGQQEDNDRKLPAKVLRKSTNAPSISAGTIIKRKRDGPSSSSSPLPSKKAKSSRLSVSTVSQGPATTGLLTRNQKQAQQVTPSPFPAKTNAGSPAFSFSTPSSKRTSSRAHTTPDGVIDLYPSADQVNDMTCSCSQDDCSSNATTTSYILSYGKDYFQYLKEREQPTIIPPSSPSIGFSSPHPSKSSESSFSPEETPEHKRDWIFFNPLAIQATPEPQEITEKLPLQPDLTPKMRSILVDWIIELSEHFEFGPSTLHLAVTLVDKVLECGPILGDDSDDDDDTVSDDEDESKTNCFLISRERFQLLGASCTWMACKIEEVNAPKVEDFSYVSDNIYTEGQIKRMERRICKALKFSFCHPTPFPYAFEFIRASHECPNPCCHAQLPPIFTDMVGYLLELGRIPYAPATKKPSLLAAAAVYLARVTLGVQSKEVSSDPQGRWTKTLEYYTGYSKSELKETVLAIHRYHMAAEESSLKSVFAKYKMKKYHRVALKTVSSVESLGF